MPMLSHYQCSQLDAPNKVNFSLYHFRQFSQKKCEVIVWNTAQQSYLGSLATTSRLVDKKKPEEICSVQFNMKNRAIPRKTFKNDCHNVTYNSWTEWSQWSECPRPCGQSAKRKFLRSLIIFRTNDFEISLKTSPKNKELPRRQS